MTISGDDYRRSRRREEASEGAPAPNRATGSELIAQGYVRPPEHQYDYNTTAGDGLYVVRRYQHPNIPNHKEIRRGIENGHDENLKPYTGVLVPYRWAELVAADPDEWVYWPEGEKDVEKLRTLGLIATTAANQQLSHTIVHALKGREVVILPDNDDKGEENAAKAVEAFRRVAKSIKAVRLPDLQHNEDVTDWLDERGGTLEKLKALVEAEPCVIEEAKRNAIRALPFALQQHSQIARREWLYKPGYIRGNVSVTAGAGARGKSSLIVAEALAMASGKPLLGVPPSRPLNVWYVNFEDDTDELKRRFNAAATFHEVTPTDIAERLMVDSGRIVIAAEDEKRRVRINENAMTSIRRTIREKQIDVAIFDPFVSMHMVSENDNGAIDLVTKALKDIAEQLGCAIMLVHHTRKPKAGEEGGTDDTRGASALVNAARYVRILNPMTSDEAARLNIDAARRGFYFSAVNGKTNLTPPAESRDWYQLESVELQNGPNFEVDGDNVGVVARFVVAAPSNALANPTMEQIRAAFAVGDRWRFDRQARSGWAGDQLALSLGVEVVGPAEKKLLDRAIRRAVQQGWLTKFIAPDARRMPREWVKLPDLATPSVGGAQTEGDAF